MLYKSDYISFLIKEKGSCFVKTLPLVCLIYFSDLTDCPLRNPRRSLVVDLVEFNRTPIRHIEIREPRTRRIASERGDADYAVSFNYLVAVPSGIPSRRLPNVFEFGNKCSVFGNFDRKRRQPEPDDFIHQLILL